MEKKAYSKFHRRSGQINDEFWGKLNPNYTCNFALILLISLSNNLEQQNYWHWPNEWILLLKKMQGQGCASISLMRSWLWHIVLVGLILMSKFKDKCLNLKTSSLF